MEVPVLVEEMEAFIWMRSDALAQKQGYGIVDSSLDMIVAILKMLGLFVAQYVSLVEEGGEIRMEGVE